MKYRKLLYGTYVSSNKRYTYDAISLVNLEKGRRNLRWFWRGWLPPLSSRILDLGCGGGHLLGFLKSLGYINLTGVDVSSEQVAYARQVLPNVVQSDIFMFLHKEGIGQFDMITAFDVLEHLTRDEMIELLGLVKIRLAKNGVLVVQLPNGDSPFVGSVFCGDATHETCLTSVSLRHILEASGFKDCRFREYDPAPTGFVSGVRYVLWQVLRVIIKAIHYVETGSPSTGIYTRTFLCRCQNK